MDRSNIEKIAKTPQERMLLAKIWDKIQSGIRRNIPANSPFLSPSEQEICQYLFGQTEGLHYCGGYDAAERKMLVYLPEYLDEAHLTSNEAPLVCLRAEFYENDALTHRDLLGALMGIGIARETVGDICVAKGSCDFFITADIAPYVLQNFVSAGRTKLQLSQVSLKQAQIPAPEVRVLRDTLASLRLDGIVSAGFRISRGLASQYISAGKAAVDGLPCEKPDKIISRGAKISLRGHGKICLAEINGQTKKGRISVVIHRYV